MSDRSNGCGVVAIRGGRAPSSLEHEARQFAMLRHEGQTYGEGIPYSVHLAHVVAVLEEHDQLDPFILASGWLHDVLEDTPTTRDELVERFGHPVASLVWAVTGVGKNRKARNASMIEKIIASPGQDAITVKLADRIANVRASVPRSRHRAMYQAEWPAFFAALHQFGGPSDLWESLIKLLGSPT